MLQIIVDNREDRGQSKFIPHLRHKCIQKQLDLGDIHFLIDSREYMIIERKTLADYAASIKDGRLQEQSIRLQHCGLHRAQIGILIEGSLPTQGIIGGIAVNAIKNSIMHKALELGFVIFYTKNGAETAEIIDRIADSFEQRPYYYAQLPKPTSGLIGGSYTPAIKRKKKANMTPRISFIAQLNSIPGVSVKTAEKIAGEYPNMRHLIVTYAQKPPTARPKMLESIEGIGKIISTRVYEYLCKDYTE